MFDHFEWQWQRMYYDRQGQIVTDRHVVAGSGAFEFVIASGDVPSFDLAEEIVGIIPALSSQMGTYPNLYLEAGSGSEHSQSEARLYRLSQAKGAYVLTVPRAA